MQKQYSKPTVFLSREGTPKVDCTNDRQMVDDNLRQPLVVKYDFSMTEDERIRLSNAKSAYKKLKQNKPLFNNLLNDVLKAFRDNRLPRWGSFKFAA